MQTTQIAPTTSPQPFRVEAAVTAPASRAAEPTPAPSAEIIDLIAAAGPLNLADLAGGLARAFDGIARRVRALTARGLLLEDEFGRYRLGPAVGAACA